MDAKREAYWWWFDSHNTPKYSPCLRSPLTDLDEKAKAMLKLIEEDADSFAQRAEMYYKKRPELISMVEDFYRAYRSLAERYDQQKTDQINRAKSPLRRSLLDFKSEFGFSSVDKSFKSEFGFVDEIYNSSSAEDCSEQSEVDDPEENYTNDEYVFEDQANLNEMVKLRKEVERLREEKSEMRRKLEEAENKLTKEKGEMLAERSYLQNVIAAKDEEKREVIRQLSLGMEIMREDHRVLKKSIFKDGQKHY